MGNLSVCIRSSPDCQWAIYLSAKEAIQIVNGQLISLKKKLSMLSMGTLSAKEAVQIVNG
jgi:hypothetical protein